jgi:alanyl-tRNA synthetase
MRAHTATHLLHAQLAAIFPQTKQAGSLVDQDYLRFDFYADTPLTQEQIDTIEQTINTQISQALPVDIQEMSYNKAIQAGAKAFFEDKYGDVVRVVKIWSSSWVKWNETKDPENTKNALDFSMWSEWLSIELCGGTHVSNTAHIGTFAIISQESVAAWTKRIIAVTGPKVAEELRTKNQEFRTIASKLWVQEKQIIDKIASVQEEIKSIQLQKDTLEQSIAKSVIGSVTEEKNGYIIIHTNKYDSLQVIWFKSLVQVTKDLWWNYILAEDSWSFAIIGGQAKSFAQSHWLKGGGSDTFFQWKDSQILELLASS